RSRSTPATSSRSRCRAPSRSPSAPGRWPPPATSTRSSASGRSSGARPPTTTSSPASAPGACSRSSSRPVCRWPSACSPPRTSARRSPAPRAPGGTTWARRPPRWPWRWRCCAGGSAPADPPGGRPRRAGAPYRIPGPGPVVPTLRGVLKLVLPKGSLERATLELFEAADLTVNRSSSVEYKATIDDPRIGEVRILRPQEIPRYVAEGLFDLGITGRDWVEETAADVVSLGEMRYSKATTRPIRMVVAVPQDSPVERVEDLPQGVRVSTEYPETTRRYFEKKGITADIRLSYGATEAKVPDIVDCIVEITETGRALRAAGLKVIDEILQSYTELVANPAAYADPEKR